MDEKLYRNYVAILRDELTAALGCTEPVAVAYAAAKVRETLGSMPSAMEITCSGNVIKNVKGVIVPNSGGMKGLDAAAILGAVGGRAEKKLEVLREVQEQHRARARALLAKGLCRISLYEGDELLYIRCDAVCGVDSASVTIQGSHTNITDITKNGRVLPIEWSACECAEEQDKSRLNMRDIYAFADAVRLEDVEAVIEQQIRMNSAIAQEGAERDWGCSVGRQMLRYDGNSVKNRAAAYAAAASDARMSGCAMPVVINSGSGNQGIAVTLPVVVYAAEWNAPREKLIRALVFANLVALHQKRQIGNLSAYCGAASASAASACGVAYLKNESFEVICNTLINTIGTIGGMICDGAKPSCAAKIRSAVDTALTGYYLAKDGCAFSSGEGIVEGDIEQTISNVGRVARVGMRGTDREIIQIMIGK